MDIKLRHTSTEQDKLLSRITEENAGDFLTEIQEILEYLDSAVDDRDYIIEQKDDIIEGLEDRIKELEE
jgi:hypothetical protein